LLGGASQVDERLKQFRKNKSALRSVPIPNPSGEQGMVQYTVIVAANSKVAELAPTLPNDTLASLNDALRAATLPQSFPDSTLKKLPRLGALTCIAPEQPCSFTLLSAFAVYRSAAME